MDDDVLKAAAAHLAGLGKGRHHRVDLQGNQILLDGVPLRGVRSYSVENSVIGPPVIVITMYVTLGVDDEPSHP